MMVYEDEIEMYNVYNGDGYMVYVIENDIVMLKMNDDQPMAVDIVQKVMIMVSVVDQITNDVMIRANELFLPIEIKILTREIKSSYILCGVNLHKSVLLVEIDLLLHMD
jgi:hypothetical protein